HSIRSIEIERRIGFSIAGSLGRADCILQFFATRELIENEVCRPIQNAVECRDHAGGACALDRFERRHCSSNGGTRAKCYSVCVRYRLQFFAFGGNQRLVCSHDMTAELQRAISQNRSALRSTDKLDNYIARLRDQLVWIESQQVFRNARLSGPR